MKRCSQCKDFKSLDQFNRNKQCKDGLHGSCKICRSEYRQRYKLQHPEKYVEDKKQWRLKYRPHITAYKAQRRALKLQQTPIWINDGYKFEMECIYTYAVALNSVGLHYHVDHRIPLQGEVVSGLHVPENLQVITAEENLKKGNKYDQTTELSKRKRIQIDPKTNRVTCQTE